MRWSRNMCIWRVSTSHKRVEARLQCLAWWSVRVMCQPSVKHAVRNLSSCLPDALDSGISITRNHLSDVKLNPTKVNVILINQLLKLHLFVSLCLVGWSKIYIGMKRPHKTIYSWALLLSVIVPKFWDTLLEQKRKHSPGTLWQSKERSSIKNLYFIGYTGSNAGWFQPLRWKQMILHHIMKWPRHTEKSTITVISKCEYSKQYKRNHIAHYDAVPSIGTVKINSNVF